MIFILKTNDCSWLLYWLIEINGVNREIALSILEKSSLEKAHETSLKMRYEMFFPSWEELETALIRM